MEYKRVPIIGLRRAFRKVISPLVQAAASINHHSALLLTIPVAKNHKHMEAGNAIMYGIFSVKLKSKNRFPSSPMATDEALRPTHLDKEVMSEKLWSLLQ